MTAQPPSQQRRLEAVFWISVGAFIASAWFSMSSIPRPPCSPWDASCSTHLGYTKSLSLFIVPNLGFSLWFWRHRSSFRAHWRPFLIASGIILLLWSVLDILLANSFFRFPDPNAHLGIYGPGFTFGRGFLEGWALDIPIEEFVFYWAGSWFILLCYLFLSEVWFKHYNLSPIEYEKGVTQVTRISLLSYKPVLLGAAVFLAAFAYKKLASAEPEGFPSYAAFLIGVVVVPSALFHRVVGPLINFRAFLVMSLSLSLLSIMWEVTLALPYGWWNYHPEPMIGIFLTPGSTCRSKRACCGWRPLGATSPCTKSCASFRAPTTPCGNCCFPGGNRRAESAMRQELPVGDGAHTLSSRGNVRLSIS